MVKHLGLLGLICVLAAAEDAAWNSAPPEELAARYAQLRAVTLDPNRAAVLENVVLPVGGAEFRFRSGTLHLFQPVGGRVAGAVFVGDGTLALTPPTEFERQQIKRFLDGATSLEEPFNEVVIVASDQALAKLSADLKWKSDGAGRAAGPLEEFRNRFREDHRRNIWARAAAGLCSDNAAQFFADVRGSKRGRFLFSVDRQYEDEVNLIHYSGTDVYDVWTSYNLPGVPSLKDRAFIDTTRTKLDVLVDKSKKLGGTAEIEFTAVAAGPRILAVQLAYNLRVSKAALDGADLKFIQEDKKKDGSLWIVLPAPLAKDRKHVLTIAYEGEDVVHSEGSGNYYVGQRTSWYPKLDVPGDLFNDRSIYQMRFRCPKNLTLVATGKLVERKVDGKIEISDWDTLVPYTVVGFNFGAFKKKAAAEGALEISALANTEQNDTLRGIANAVDDDRGASGITSGGLNTAGMIDAMLAEGRNSVRIYSSLFGPLPYPAVAMTQQPAAFYGQSWPTLIFMPFTSFLDSTMRNQLELNRTRSERQFFDTVASHEVAHQWWGHLVSPRADRDTWLSEGFAEFSAGMFTQIVKGEKNFKSHLDHLKETITSPLDRSTMKAYEAGPISLASRLSSEKTRGAYQRIVYYKGAYVLHMLRMMMYDFGGRGDAAFSVMMKEFTSTYAGRDVSTEDFQALVTKHSGGRDSSWFFNQWVHGVDYPRITVQYSVTPNDKGAVFSGTISQRGVSKDFVSIVPVRISIGKGAGTIRLAVQGESNTFNIQIPAVPTTFEFNPLQAWLCDLEVKKL